MDNNYLEPVPKLAENLRRLMSQELVEGKPITSSELARRSGINQSTIFRIMRGETRDPRMGILVSLANCLGRSVGELRGEVKLARQRRGELLPIPSGKNGKADLEIPTFLVNLDAVEWELIRCYRLTSEVK